MASTVADQVRAMRERIIANRVAVPSIHRVLPESARQAAAQAIAAQAVYGGGLSQRINDVSVSARPMPSPRASMLGALQREMAKPCPTGYVRDGRGECVVVIQTGTPQNAIPMEYRAGPTLSQFRPVLDLDAARPGRSTTESLQTLKRNLGRMSVGLNGLGSASKKVELRAARSGLAGLGQLLTTSPTISTVSIIDGLNAQISTLNAQVTKLQSDYAALNAACQKSADALSSCSATLANTKAALDAANARIAALTTQVTSLTTQLNTANASLSDMKRVIAERDATIASVNAALTDVRSQLAAAQNDIKALTDKLTVANGALTTAQTREREVSSQLVAANGQIDALRAQLAAVAADRDALAAAAQSATTQLSSANSAIAALKAVCSTLSAPAATSMNGLGAGLTLPNYGEMYSKCLDLARQLKAELDAKSGFIDPATCPKAECPSCPDTDLPPTAQKAANWLPLVVAGASAIKLFS